MGIKTQYRKSFINNLTKAEFNKLITSEVDVTDSYSINYFRELIEFTESNFAQEILDAILRNGFAVAIEEDIVSDYESTSYDQWLETKPDRDEYTCFDDYESDRDDHYSKRPVKVLGFKLILRSVN